MINNFSPRNLSYHLLPWSIFLSPLSSFAWYSTQLLYILWITLSKNVVGQFSFFLGWL